MRTIVIGSMCGIAAVMLGGCGLGAGHDADQIVKKDPETVYAALDSAFSDAVADGNHGAAAEHGQVTTIDRDPGKSLDLKVMIEGKQAVRMRFGVEPANGGADTRLTGDIDVDQAVLRESIREQGGDDAKLPAIPSFAFDMAMKKVVAEIGKKIEAGEPLGGSRSTLAMATSPDPSPSASESRWEQRRRQEAATRPMVDPDADARKYLNQPSY
ncbi:MAG TPA: hypothetical protein VJM15_05430 [Sphingomicrobium sp.]|nr:hypothetical protein [Sphingomicrobium sp.]